MPKSTRVTVVDLPQDDSWFRDTGPVVSLGTSARESCCISSATLNLGGNCKPSGMATISSELAFHCPVCGSAG